VSKPKGNIDKSETEANLVSVAQMRAGQRGKIVKIDGGHGLERKLEALGIRPGKEVTKISAQWMRGPVLLQQDNTQVALGFGMASKVLVELSGRNEK